MALGGGALAEVARSLASISRAPLRLKSFHTSQWMETGPQIARVVVAHYERAALGQLLNLAGSLASLGNPANLIGGIATGVQEFFYAPAAGAVESPEAFVRGVAEGTGSLVGGVVGGVLDRGRRRRDRKLGRITLGADARYRAARRARPRARGDAGALGGRGGRAELRRLYDA